MGRLDKFRIKGQPMPHYQRHDMEVLFSRGKWQRWEEAIDWLEQHGREERELTGDVDEMLRDLRQLQYDHVTIPENGRRAYELAMEQHDWRTPVTKKPEVPEVDETE